jgi:hypothetical protein
MKCACGQAATAEIITADRRFLVCPICSARWWADFMRSDVELVQRPVVAIAEGPGLRAE